MLKKVITYKDFNDQPRSSTHYFNLSTSELIEMNFSDEQDLSAVIQRIIESDNQNQLIAIFKQLILAAYGKKSDDGERFIKSDELREEFSQTAAYDAMFTEMATSENAAADFIRGIVPSDLGKQLEKQINDDMKKNSGATVTELMATGLLPPPPPPAA